MVRVDVEEVVEDEQGIEEVVMSEEEAREGEVIRKDEDNH